ncbi:MAG: SH3 domain-containing protein [bacterium]
MTEPLTDLEDRLRTAVRAHTAHAVTNDHGSVDAIRSRVHAARRRRRLMAAGAAVAAVAAVVVVALPRLEDDRDAVTTGPDRETSTTPSTTTTAPPATEPPGAASLPGERVDIFPYEGAQLTVVGVAADDTLNVRSGPGLDFDVLTQLDPLATNVTATGHNRSLGDTDVWSELTVDGKTGWANRAFLMQSGQVTDVTTALFPTPADRPAAATMLELGELVAGRRASDDPPSDIVVVDGPTVGDVPEITLDVIGLGGDAQGGERLKIFAERGPGGEGVTVRAVEATRLCLRAVTEDGLCV